MSRLLYLAPLIAITWAPAGATRPATGPTAYDRTTPQATLRSALSAILVDDPGGLRACARFDREAAGLIDVQIDWVLALADLVRAEDPILKPEDRQGEAYAMLFHPFTERGVAEFHAEVERARLIRDGDRATLTLPPDPRQREPGIAWALFNNEVPFVRVGQEWKLDATLLGRSLKAASPEAIAAMKQKMAEWSRQAAKMRRLARIVRDRKLRTLAEAQAAANELDPGTRPSTAPAEEP